MMLPLLLLLLQMMGRMGMKLPRKVGSRAVAVGVVAAAAAAAAAAVAGVVAESIFLAAGTRQCGTHRMMRLWPTTVSRHSMSLALWLDPSVVVVAAAALLFVSGKCSHRSPRFEEKGKVRSIGGSSCQPLLLTCRVETTSDFKSKVKCRAKVSEKNHKTQKTEKKSQKCDGNRFESSCKQRFRLIMFCTLSFEVVMRRLDY